MKPEIENLNMSILTQFISKGEHQQQDFKHSIGSTKKIAITLCAFANTNGGRLLIGVKDNGKISGVNPEEELHMIEGAAQVYCKPEVTFTVNVHVYESKQILEIWVPESAEKPHLAKTEMNKWMAYIRVEDENFLTDPVVLQYWKNSNLLSKTQIKYTPQDKLFIQFLEQNPQSTYKQVALQKISSRHQTINSLAKLLRWQIIYFLIDENGIYYSLKEEV